MTAKFILLIWGPLYKSINQSKHEKKKAKASLLILIREVEDTFVPVSLIYKSKMLDLCKLEEICQKYPGKFLSLVFLFSIYLLNQMRFWFFSYVKNLIRIPLLSHIKFQVWELETLRNSLEQKSIRDITLLTKQISCTISTTRISVQQKV